jgi:hypothetical protein
MNPAFPRVFIFGTKTQAGAIQIKPIIPFLRAWFSLYYLGLIILLRIYNSTIIQDKKYTERGVFDLKQTPFQSYYIISFFILGVNKMLAQYFFVQL